MLDSQSSFQPSTDLVVVLTWAAHTTTFVQDWQRRLQAAETPGTHAEQHVLEAASIVLSTVEQLDTYAAQVLTDLYRLSGQLPALGDRLLIGPLELRVEERQLAVRHQGVTEQVIATYCLDIVRYLYEAPQAAPFSIANFPLTA